MDSPMTRSTTLTPPGVVVRGAAAGAVGTVAMDLLWFSRYRRNGGDSRFVDWADHLLTVDPDRGLHDAWG